MEAFVKRHNLSVACGSLRIVAMAIELKIGHGIAKV
jgi:hypothetical protein